MELTRTTVYMGAQTEQDGAKVVIFGCPYDGTCSFRPGTRFGPSAIREVSEGIETYCPIQNRDLEDLIFADLGDLILPPGDKDKSLEMIYQMAREIYQSGQIPAAFGGEHLVSLPLVKAALETYPDLVIVQFDAHMDLRNNYLGTELSHATVMRQITHMVQPSRILQVGQRSGTREEYEFSKKHGIHRTSEVSVEEIQNWIGNKPLYVTVDLDVLDPSILPGTGTPEPGGVTFKQLEEWLAGLSGLKWIGWDMVELSPQYDVSQVSSVVSAKVARTMLLSSTGRFQ